MRELIENMGTLAPILTAIFGVSISGLLVSLFTSLSYDSFDMRLVQRDKFALIRFKQFIGAFLIIIPTYCLTAFMLAYQATFIPFFFWIIIISTILVTVCIILSSIVSFLESIYTKSANFSRLLWITNTLGKIIPIYEINLKLKVYFSLTFMLLTLTLIAYVYTSDNFDSPLSNLTEYLLVMFGVATLIILSMLSKKKPINYIFVGEHETLEELQDILGRENEILLEYFFSDTIAVLSTKDKEYRVIKRISESKNTYEIFKSLE